MSQRHTGLCFSPSAAHMSCTHPASNGTSQKRLQGSKGKCKEWHQEAEDELQHVSGITKL